MTLIAGTLALSDVMGALSARRPVFHSEADFQFEFARSVAYLDPAIRIRLEVPQRRENKRNEYVDLLCETDDARSLIEFKYATRRWDGVDPRTGECFNLRSHAAMDLARLHFIHDVYRLEQWTSERDHTNGFAVLLSNAASLWQPAPQPGTRDAAYRLDQGRTLTGDLIWGTPDRPAERNNRHLNGTYVTDWHDYGDQPLPGDQPGNRLRWLGWAITRQ